MAICLATAASSSEVRAILFPTVITYQINDEVTRSDGEDIILNYNQHLYVPLRSFAEHMGSTVEYAPPGSYGHSKATVSVYKLDDKDFTIFDESNTVGMGKFTLSFDDLNYSAPLLTGTLKFNQSLPTDKQLVVSLLNQDGDVIAVSEQLKLAYRQADEMVAGEITKFSTEFPYIDEPDQYSLQLQIVPQTTWNFNQIYSESVLTGAGGLDGYPLIVGTYIDADTVKLNQSVEIGARLINISDDDDITIQEDLFFYLDIYKMENNSRVLVRTLKTEPFTGNIPYRKGSYYTSVSWDQKDENGNSLAKGEYWFKPRLPSQATGTLSSDPEKTVTFELEDSMGANQIILIE